VTDTLKASARVRVRAKEATSTDRKPMRS
jgi:hypothetical protein